MISQNLTGSQTIAFDSDGRIGVATYQRAGLTCLRLDAGCWTTRLWCQALRPKMGACSGGVDLAAVVILMGAE